MCSAASRHMPEDHSRESQARGTSPPSNRAQQLGSTHAAAGLTVRKASVSDLTPPVQSSVRHLFSGFLHNRHSQNDPIHTKTVDASVMMATAPTRGHADKMATFTAP